MWHALLMPHMLIKYAHVLICISVGEGFQHFSAISLCRGTSNSDVDYLRKYGIIFYIHTIPFTRVV